MKKPTAAQVRLLAAIERGSIGYTQATGAFGARYINTVNRETIAKNRMHALERAGLVTGPTVAQRMGGPFDMTIRLTAEGRAVLDGAR